MGQECRFHLNHVACTSFGEGLKPGKAAKSFAHSRSLEMAQPNLQRQVRSNLFPCWKKESCCCCFCWVTVCTCSAGQRFAGTVGWAPNCFFPRSHFNFKHEALVRSKCFFCMFFSLNGYKCVSQYLALEEHAVTWDPDDTTTWRARPKFHLLQHILDEVCKGLHPKYGTIEMKHLGIQCSSYGSEEVAKPRAPKSKVNQFC